MSHLVSNLSTASPIVSMRSYEKPSSQALHVSASNTARVLGTLHTRTKQFA